MLMHEDWVSREEFDKLEKLYSEIVAKLQSRIKELEAKLAWYENPHTPPSMRVNRYPVREKSDKPPGKPRGGNGGTKILGTPDRVEVVTKKVCKRCKELLGEPLGYISHKILEMPPIPKVEIVEYKLGYYGTHYCGAENIADHPQCPIKGDASASTLALVQDLRVTERLSIGLTLRFLKERFGAQFSPGSIVSFTKRTAKFLEHEHFLLVNKIRNSKVLYIDETGFYVNGKRIWMWIFTNGEDVLIVIRNSRGSKIIENVLGKTFRGVVVSDCFSAYLRYQMRYGIRFQKCWAHLLREARKCAQCCEEGKAVYDELKIFFDRMRKFIDTKPSDNDRTLEYQYALNWLDSFTSRQFMEDCIPKVFNRLKRYRECWFTCILIQGVEPTNNTAERGLRPQVIIRRLRGSLRSEESIKDHEIIHSLFATWHNKGLYPAKELEKKLCSIFAGS